MASSPSAAALTEGHRLAQARIGAQTVRLMRSAWPLLDPSDLDGSMARWLRVSVPLVSRQSAMSARLAAQYLRAFRALELGLSDYVPIVVTSDTTAITTSLTVTGPVRIKEQARRAVPFIRALSVAEAASASSALRHALNGGRSTITESVRADRSALGWARVTSGDPCHFCAMLASRGPVFKGESFDASDPRFSGSGEAKVHDNCSCGIEPVYRRDTGWPPGSERYRDLWREAKKLDGDTAINFRQLVEGRA